MDGKRLPELVTLDEAVAWPTPILPPDPQTVAVARQATTEGFSTPQDREMVAATEKRKEADKPITEEQPKYGVVEGATFLGRFESDVDVWYDVDLWYKVIDGVEYVDFQSCSIHSSDWSKREELPSLRIEAWRRVDERKAATEPVAEYLNPHSDCDCEAHEAARDRAGVPRLKPVEESSPSQAMPACDAFVALPPVYSPPITGLQHKAFEALRELIQVVRNHDERLRKGGL
jgi:hypothetical protein